MTYVTTQTIHAIQMATERGDKRFRKELAELGRVQSTRIFAFFRKRMQSRVQIACDKDAS